MSSRGLKRAAVLAVLLLLGTGARTVHAQTGRVVGVVTDQGSGQPITNVQITVTGTKLGTMSGESGRYSITAIPAGTYTIEARRIGYQSRKFENVQVGSDAVTLDIGMQVTTLRLSEVVVTGVVDPIEKEKIPFSVGKVSAEDIPVPVVAASAIIQGKVAGATIVKAGGQPGSGSYVQLRSPTSIQKSSSPMYVVDGVVLGTAFSGTTVDLETLDIESIEVVKGAAAASLYGSRAASGVISIRTKRGRDATFGTTRVTTRSEFGFSELPKRISLNTHHWYAQGANGEFVDAKGNPAPRAASRALAADKISDNVYPTPLYDNLGAFFRPGQLRTNSVSVSQNGERTNFLLSYNNLRETGVLATNDGMLRHTIRLNLDNRFNEAFSVSTSLSHGRTHLDDLSGSPFQDLIYYPPDVNLGQKGPDGKYIFAPDSTVAIDNPIWRQTSRDNYTDRLRTLASGDARYSPFEWLRVDGNLSYDRSDISSNVYVPKGTPSSSGGESTGQLTKDVQFTDALNASVSASVLHQFGRLNTRVTARALTERERSTYFMSQGTNLIVRDVPDLDVARDKSISSSYNDTRSNGYFVQSGADYDGKYIADVLFRRDGSSRFGPEEQWQSYYRVAGSYLLAREKWWPFPVFNEFKLRASLGTAGGRPGFSDQYETYSVSTTGAVSKSTLGNKYLKPEFTTEREYGIDMALWNRVSLELTYARATTRDQIIQMPQPAVTGYSSQWQNAGTITGHTYEGTLRADVYRSKNLNWSMNLVADRSTNKITEWNRTCFTTTLGLNCKGATRGVMYGYQFLTSADGLPAVHAGSKDQFQVNDDGYLVPVGKGNSWKDGLAKNLWNTTVVIDGVSYQWGLPLTLKAANGVTDTLVRVGAAAPRLKLGYANNVRWRSFSFYGLLDWQLGGNVYNATKQRLYQYSRSGDVDQFGKAEETKKTIDYYLRLYNSNAVVSHFVEPGSFLKLRELSARYNVSPALLQRTGITRVGAERIALGIVGRNLFTNTRYSGYDPEVGTSVFQRIDSTTDYPHYRSVTGTIEITF